MEEDFYTSIVNDDMKRENIRVVEAPYYRICDASAANDWKPSREATLEGYSEENSGDIVWEIDGTTGNKLKTKDLTENKIKNTQCA